MTVRLAISTKGIPVIFKQLCLFAGIFLTCSLGAQAQTVVQTFYIPFDEEEVNIALNTIDDFNGGIGNTLRSTISIVGGITNTVIYWDHWEDGYEDNILAPTQSTSRVWGDNNSANGIPTGFANDFVNEGTIITLTNDITMPRNPSTIYYDARDKMSVSRWVAVSRYLYAPDPGEVLADCAQVYDRSKFGFSFRAPVGIDTGTNQMFEYSSIHVAAGYDSTVVRIDVDADGNDDETVFLNEGESYVSRFTFEGARVEASKPVQAQMITGDIGSNYEMRFFEMFPSGQWDTNYFTSVDSADFLLGGIPTEVYFFNPNDDAINVVCETRFSTSVVSVAANDTSTFLMPSDSGASFYTTNGSQFIAVSATDARQSSSGNQAYDWGHALVPVRALTTVSIVPWAPGAGGGSLLSLENGSPIWVTPETNTTIYVDLDGNPSTGPLTDPFGRRYNYTIDVDRLEAVRIFDNTDNDQTGIRLYTIDGARFSTTWGQDPEVALPGNPYLDMGAAVFPFPTVPAVKEWALAEDLNDDGVVNPGDSIRFTIYVVNVGYSDANNVTVFDSGASNTTYTLGSSFLNATNIADDTVPPAVSEFPFDENGYNVGYIAIGRTAIVSYVVMINDPFPTNTDGIVNGVYVDNETQVFVPVPIPGFSMTKSSTTNLLYPTETINYTIDIQSTANVYQTGVQLIDQLPSSVTYVPGSTRVIVYGNYIGSFIDSFEEEFEYNGSDGALSWMTDWTEIGEANGAGSGNIQVMTDDDVPGALNMLRVQGSSSGINIGAMRRADIARFTNATLSFDYRRESMDGGQSVSVSASSNGGSSWTVLTNLSGAATDADYITVSNLNLNAYRTTNFAVRFLANSSMDDNDRAWIDNVQVTVMGNNVTNIGGTPPLLFSNYGISSGQSVRVTFNATINGDISSSQVVNRAFINSFASPAPLEASVTNIVVLPQRSEIAGYVRNDLNADGNTANTSYPGISGIPVTLYTDPNRDGNPADGAIVASTNTDVNGYFYLGSFLSNSYVILQTDLANWRSTGDSDGGNSNRIGFVSASGVNFTNNVFLDTRLAFISGQVRYDADGDGSLLDADSGIEGVTITLYTDPNGDGDPGDGSAISSRVTSVTGDFTFLRVSTGNYVLVESDLPELVSMADSQGTNDNRIAISMPGGVDTSGHAFLDTSSGLSITKTSNPPGIWFPTLQAEYTITVVNTGLFTHTGVNITDIVGDGLAVVTNSPRTTTIFNNVQVNANGSVRDDFSSASYALNTGTNSWSGSWTEQNESSSSPSAGAILITNGRLRFTNTNNANASVYREVNLTNALYASLMFRYEASNNLESSDSVILEISTNNGSSYTTLTNITGITGSRSGVSTNNILSHATSDTRIRFRVNNGYTSSDELFRVDWVQIVYTNFSLQTLTNNFASPPPVNMATGYSLGPNDSISIVFTSVVDILVHGVTNTACVTSSILTNGLCDTVINSVDPDATPDRVSGQVRYDANGDGVLTDPDEGIQSVVITLYSDPNGDGNPADGSVLDSTITDVGGFYIFGDLSSGTYVIVQTDLSGYISTADAVGSNNNQIAVHLTGGVDSRDNDFLDWTISGLTISKYNNAGDIVVPGEKLVYSIIVSNARSLTATGIRIVDPLPAGVVYVPSSAWVEIDGVIVTNSVRDLFNARAYTNQDGNVLWNNSWTETNDSGGATSGSILVTNDFSAQRLRLSNLNRWIQRSANVLGGTEVTLSYFYRRQSLESGEYVLVEISTNMSTWVEIAKHEHISGGSSSQSDSSYQFNSVDVSAYASTNTTIRLRTAPSGNMNTADFVYFDDISFDFGYTVNNSGPCDPPPTFVTNQTLASRGVIKITFTTDVTIVDAIVNTAVVYTVSDTNGLRASVSNLVGSLIMTQGMVVLNADSLGVKVGWSAYTNQEGDVSKEYDILYVDDGNLGFHPGLTNHWVHVTTIQDRDFVDFGEGARESPADIGNKMRFYRAAFKETWETNKSPRYATREIYVAKCVPLEEGENFLSLFSVPDRNRLDFIFGTNLLPSGSTMAESTRIEWYAPTAESEATNVVWLSDAGVWQYATGGIANTMSIPLHQGFNLITPPGAGDREIVLVGRVPTNTSGTIGHSVPIVANGNFNIVSYNVPYKVRLIDTGLKEAGFTGVAPGKTFNPNNSDEIRILQKGGGSLQSPIYRILMNSSGQFQYWTGGTGVADNLRLEPDYAIIIYSRKALTNYTWNVSMPYPEPSVFMAP